MSIFGHLYAVIMESLISKGATMHRNITVQLKQGRTGMSFCIAVNNGNEQQQRNAPTVFLSLCRLPRLLFASLTGALLGAEFSICLGAGCAISTFSLLHSFVHSSIPPPSACTLARDIYRWRGNILKHQFYLSL